MRCEETRKVDETPKTSEQISRWSRNNRIKLSSLTFLFCKLLTMTEKKTPNAAWNSTIRSRYDWRHSEMQIRHKNVTNKSQFSMPQLLFFIVRWNKHERSASIDVRVICGLQHRHVDYFHLTLFFSVVCCLLEANKKLRQRPRWVVRVVCIQTQQIVWRRR